MKSIFYVFTTFADWFTFSLLGIEKGSQIYHSVHFFVEDITKISFMLIVLIYLIGIARSSLNIERIRDYLSGKNRFIGYILASIFGGITPFCSCSSIPLFMAFTSARIPIGITMSFLITSPLINEIAIILLGSILGIKFTIIYISVGISAGIIGGIFFDFIGAEKHLSPLGIKSLEHAKQQDTSSYDSSATCCCRNKKQESKISWRSRHDFAKNEVKAILSRIWKWVFIGVAVGAIFHGFVPIEWIEEYLASGDWWTVPLSSIMGIPLYLNASAMVPIAEAMLQKGVPIGTTLTFMMSVTGASFPELLMLKQVMKPKLLFMFFALLLILFTLSGWLFNNVSPILGISL